MSLTASSRAPPNPLASLLSRPLSSPRCPKGGPETPPQTCSPSPPSSPCQRNAFFQVLRPKASGHPGLLSFFNPSANPDGTHLKQIQDPTTTHLLGSRGGFRVSLPAPTLTPVCSRQRHQRAPFVTEVSSRLLTESWSLALPSLRVKARSSLRPVGPEGSGHGPLSGLSQALPLHSLTSSPSYTPPHFSYRAFALTFPTDLHVPHSGLFQAQMSPAQ